MNAVSPLRADVDRTRTMAVPETYATSVGHSIGPPASSGGLVSPLPAFRLLPSAFFIFGTLRYPLVPSEGPVCRKWCKKSAETVQKSSVFITRHLWMFAGPRDPRIPRAAANQLARPDASPRLVEGFPWAMSQLLEGMETARDHGNDVVRPSSIDRLRCALSRRAIPAAFSPERSALPLREPHPVQGPAAGWEKTLLRTCIPSNDLIIKQKAVCRTTRIRMAQKTQRRALCSPVGPELVYAD